MKPSAILPLICLLPVSVSALPRSERTITGRYLLEVEVAPLADSNRAEDEQVARTQLDLYRQFPNAPKNHRIDLHSLRIVRTGDQAGSYPRHAQQKHPGDRPFRFYDEGLLDDFPTWRRYASLEKLGGRPLFQMREKLPFGHRVFGGIGDNVKGTLVWAHTQTGNHVSTYAISFDVIPASRPQSAPPVGWIGDGGNRFVPKSPLVGPPGNNSASVTDWNRDGLPDLL